MELVAIAVSLVSLVANILTFRMVSKWFKVTDLALEPALESFIEEPLIIYRTKEDVVEETVQKPVSVPDESHQAWRNTSYGPDQAPQAPPRKWDYVGGPSPTSGPLERPSGFAR